MMIKNCTMTTFCKLTNAVCETMNKSWVTINQCRLRAINRNLTTLTIEVKLLHPAKVIDVGLELKTKAFGYRNSIFKDFSTINHTCPYEGIQMVKDFYYDPTNLTLPIPSGDYVLLFTFMFDKKPQLTTRVHFSFFQDIINV
ncbi:hypothetical protein ACLKA7_012344 [Drosophila subpalustris]